MHIAHVTDQLAVETLKQGRLTRRTVCTLHTLRQFESSMKKLIKATALAKLN